MVRSPKIMFRKPYAWKNHITGGVKIIVCKVMSQMISSVFRLAKTVEELENSILAIK